jgi:hypothetical protein
MSQNITLGSLPFLDVFGLQLAWASATTLTVAAGQARDSANKNDIILDTGVTIDGTVNGVNGLDTGSLQNTAWYYVYLIGSSLNAQKPACLLSLSTTPALPYGYDNYRRIGAVLTDGSAHFLLFYTDGNSNLRKYTWDAPISVLTTTGATTYTQITCSSAIPPTAITARFNSQFVPNTAGNTWKVRTTGSTSTTNLTGSGTATTVSTYSCFEIITNSSRSIDFVTQDSADGLALSVTGFDDFI